jgi:hypothetical protein
MCADREANSTEEIEVTAEMIEAGLHEYGTRWGGLRDTEADVEREMVIEVYKAMYSRRPRSDHAAERTAPCAE